MNHDLDKPGSSATLLIDCPDQKGLVAAIANFLYAHNANILHADQHQDRDLGLFFMRVEWDLKDFDLERSSFQEHFSPVATRFKMSWRISYSCDRPRVAIFVSHHLHCLIDLLHRVQTRELECDVACVISNHVDAESLTRFHQVPFKLIPVNQENKCEAEREQIASLREQRVSLLVLARYMQILSPTFVDEFPYRIINVHHSFLPAFKGAKPYHAAFRRGVKLIGATSHYVTAELDDGPIIDQDVVRISHRDAPPDLIQKGRDLERVVLARAVRWHLENRVLCYGNKTVVFD